MRHSVPNVLGIVSFKVFPALMGGQKYIVDYYSVLSQKTKVVLAVSKDNQGALPLDSSLQVLPFLFNHWYGFLNILYCPRLIRLIKKEQIDVIMIDHSYFGWLGVLLRLFTGKPIVIKSANLEAYRFKDMRRWGWQLYELYEKWVHQKANRNFFISDEERQFAIEHWAINSTISYTVPYGTFKTAQVSPEQKQLKRQALLEQFKLSPFTKLFLFNGTLDYTPNEDALYVIVNELIPRLNASKIPYRIIVAGVQIKANWEAQLLLHPSIIFTGFVNDIDNFYQGANCFICPITLGTGVKTKIIDAIAEGQMVIATKKSCQGLTPASLQQQLMVIEDYDWDGFARAMVQLDITQATQTPQSFYTQYHWDHIVQESILSLPR